MVKGTGSSGRKTAVADSQARSDLRPVRVMPNFSFEGPMDRSGPRRPEGNCFSPWVLEARATMSKAVLMLAGGLVLWGVAARAADDVRIVPPAAEATCCSPGSCGDSGAGCGTGCCGSSGLQGTRGCLSKHFQWLYPLGDWLSYQPLQRPGCCYGCCRCEPCCVPHLYAFFLCKDGCCSAPLPSYSSMPYQPEPTCGGRGCPTCGSHP